MTTIMESPTREEHDAIVALVDDSIRYHKYMGNKATVKKLEGWANKYRSAYKAGARTG